MRRRLQGIILPDLALGAPLALYARTHGPCRVSLAHKRLSFTETGRVSFDTYFNGMTVAAWKGDCGIADLFLTLHGAGAFILRFGVHRLNYAHTRESRRAGLSQRWLHEQEIQLAEGEPASLELPFWDCLDGGILYLEMESLGRGHLDSGYFATTTEPANPVKLGIVITHFNRRPYVVPAIRRMRDGILNHPDYRDHIRLIVVDNSRTIEPVEAEGATLIPSHNLGGSGGFARGLLHLQDDGSFTHCLFMDDDASCELEAIIRAYALLSHAKAPKFAVAGGLLREDEPYRLFEKGARFDGVCHSLKSGLDMRSIRHLLAAESVDQKPDYGAWWFLAFRIEDAACFPFPYFVRGDDVMFGIANRLAIRTLNGIGCWGGDFGVKKGPLTSYLDMRSHLLNALAMRDRGWSFLAIFFLYSVMRQLLSYNYASARAITLALAHLLQGPEFWRRNVDMTRVREQIAAFASPENLSAIQRQDYAVVYADARESLPRKLLRLATLNGFLAPTFLLKNATVFQHKGFYGSAREIFPHQRVLYECESLGVGYLAWHDKRKFFAGLFDAGRMTLALAWHYRRLRMDYREAVVELSSSGFWRDIFERDSRPATGPVSPAKGLTS